MQKKTININACQELGFIKFGSRVDIFLPLGTKITSKINDNVKRRRKCNWNLLKFDIFV